MAADSPQDRPRPSSLIDRLLSGPISVVLRRFGIRPSPEEIREMLREGILAGAGHEIVERVFRLGDLRANDLMTPMMGVTWLDIADPPEVLQRKIVESPHSRFP